MATRLSDIAANVEANALATLLAGGYFRIYDGTQPPDANTPIGKQNKLAELRFGTPAFVPASSGTLTANPIASDPDAAKSGTATWFRWFKADGTPVLDGSIGTSGANLNMAAVNIQQHAIVSISNYTYSVTE
jgi:hypothetical protein